MKALLLLLACLLLLLHFSLLLSSLSKNYSTPSRGRLATDKCNAENAAGRF
jgi:hypothetical protein